MKKWIACSFFLNLLCFVAFAQENTQPEKKTSEKPNSSISSEKPSTNAPNMSEIATELEKTGALVEKISAEQLAQDTSKPQEPSIDSILTGGPSSLIQYDPESFLEKMDPYPLYSYQGPYLKDINAIKQVFQMENIQQVKASLDYWYQNDKNTFPLEGFLMLATIYDQYQNYDKANSLLGEGMTMADEDQKNIFRMNQAQVLRHAGKNKEAIELLNTLGTSVLTQYPEIFFSKALSYLYLSSNDLAILNFRRYLDALPSGPQNAKVRRAIAWLILNRSGQVSNKSEGTAQNSGADSGQNLEKMLQLLVDRQLSDQVGDLIKSTTTAVDTKALDIQEKELEDLAEYSNIAD